jgi:uncharacterized protein YpiB (UPF0302 family)
MNTLKPELTLYIVIDNSMLIYQVEQYDEQKNIAGLILYKNLTDFIENNPLKKIDVAEWQ